MANAQPVAMPGPSQILEGLGAIAKQWQTVAFLWHLILGGALAALATGYFRPSARLAATLATLPLGSVALFAFLHGNPFNGAVFTLGTIAALVAASRADRRPVGLGPRWAVWLGVFMIAFGWLYPHFLETRPAWLYVMAAPFGLIPCPSLSVVIGLTLLGRGFRTRAFLLVVGVLGLFYGAFGVMRLGVALDAPLILAAAAVLRFAWRSARESGAGDAHAPQPVQS